MTHVVTSACVKCKYQDCVAVCPVDCFREAGEYLVIDPDDCIDCMACVPECPVDAIKPDTEEGSKKWVDINKEFSEIWPNINSKKEPPADWKNFENEEDKYKKYFKENL